eukprot:TRINITY_DN514_c0_g1_i2.p1 TRINITY_DN514_c0_g1~~TRINITY_DN514_c0_g1_i2.p1  ORF type:complete len:1033 (+),score=411.62 TRINITY_DN514_c0_g1_i2:102-3200(+)
MGLFRKKKAKTPIPVTIPKPEPKKQGNVYPIKIVVFGDRETGKTQLLNRLSRKPFEKVYKPTPEISISHVNWAPASNLNEENDVCDVEVWDVVERAELKSSRSLLDDDTPAAMVQKKKKQQDNWKRTMERRGSTTIGALDANTVDIYRGANCVILMYDPRSKESFEFLERTIANVPHNLPTMVLANYRDITVKSNQVIKNGDAIELVAKCQAMRAEQGRSPGTVMFQECSILNCFGLKVLHTFLNLPFLKQREEYLLGKLDNVREMYKDTQTNVAMSSMETSYEEYLATTSRPNTPMDSTSDATDTLRPTKMTLPELTAKPLPSQDSSNMEVPTVLVAETPITPAKNDKPKKNKKNKKGKSNKGKSKSSKSIVNDSEIEADPLFPLSPKKHLRPSKPAPVDTSLLGSVDEFVPSFGFDDDDFFNDVESSAEKQKRINREKVAKLKREVSSKQLNSSEDEDDSSEQEDDSTSGSDTDEHSDNGDGALFDDMPMELDGFEEASPMKSFETEVSVETHEKQDEPEEIPLMSISDDEDYAVVDEVKTTSVPSKRKKTSSTNKRRKKRTSTKESAVNETPPSSSATKKTNKRRKTKRSKSKQLVIDNTDIEMDEGISVALEEHDEPTIDVEPLIADEDEPLINNDDDDDITPSEETNEPLVSEDNILEPERIVKEDDNSKKNEDTMAAEIDDFCPGSDNGSMLDLDFGEMTFDDGFLNDNEGKDDDEVVLYSKNEDNEQDRAIVETADDTDDDETPMIIMNNDDSSDSESETPLIEETAENEESDVIPMISAPLIEETAENEESDVIPMVSAPLIEEDHESDIHMEDSESEHEFSKDNVKSVEEEHNKSDIHMELSESEHEFSKDNVKSVVEEKDEDDMYAFNPIGSDELNLDFGDDDLLLETEEPTKPIEEHTQENDDDKNDKSNIVESEDDDMFAFNPMGSMDQGMDLEFNNDDFMMTTTDSIKVDDNGEQQEEESHSSSENQINIHNDEDNKDNGKKDDDDDMFNFAPSMGDGDDFFGGGDSFGEMSFDFNNVS